MPNRSARTRMSGRPGGRPAPVQTQIIRREIPEAAAAAGADQVVRLSMLMGDAVQGFSNMLHRREARQEAEAKEAETERLRDENRQLGREAVRVALDDPNGVDVALTSGDPKALAALSTLPGIDANRPEFLEQLKITHGSNKARTDYTERFKPAVEQLDYMSGNPSKFRQEFQDEAMKGADPTFDYGYRKTFEEISERDVESWYSQQRDFMLNRTVEQRVDAFKGRILAGDPIGPDDVDEFIGSVVSINPSPEGKVKARDRAVYTLFDLAHSTDNDGLMQALTRPDPKNNGLSLADIHRDLWDRALNKGLENFHQVKSVEAAQDLARLELLTTSVETGVGEDIPDPETLLAEVQSHVSKHGFSNQWKSLTQRVMNIYGKEIEYEAGYEALSSAVSVAGSSPTAGAPYVPSASLDKHGSRFADDYVARRTQEGASPAQVTGELAKIVADYGGLGSQWNQKINHQLLNGDPETSLGAYQFLKAVEKSRGEPGAVSSVLTDPIAKAKFDFVYTYAERYGGNPAQAMARFDEAAKQQGETDWRDYITKVMPVKEADAWVEAVADDVKDQTGAPLSITAVRTIRQELSRQLWMQGQNVNLGDAEVFKGAVAKSLVDQLETSYDERSGERVSTIRQTPRVVMLPDGTVLAAPAITGATHDRAIKQYEKDVIPVLGTILGPKAVGIKVSQSAKFGIGATVVVENESGDKAEMIFPYGPIDSSETNDDGSVSMQVPPANLPNGITWNGKGITVENTGVPIRIGEFAITPHPSIPGWAALTYMGPVPKTEAQVKEETKVRLMEKAQELDTRKQEDTKAAAQDAAHTEAIRAEFERTGVPPQHVVPPPDAGRVPTATPPDQAPAGQPATGTSLPWPPPSGNAREQIEGLKTKAKEAWGAVKEWMAAPSVKEAERQGRGTPPSQEKKWSEKYFGWIRRMSDDGRMSGDTAQRLTGVSVRNAEEFSAATQAGFHKALARGNQWTVPGQRGLLGAASDYIVNEEGLSLASYKDGKTRSVGFGFNLRRNDAKPLLEQMGLEWSKVWSGEQRLSRKQAEQLKDYETRRLHTVLREKLPDTPLYDHQKIALLDIMYNRGEGVLYDLMPFLKAGDLNAAAAKIRNLPIASYHPERVKEVLRSRYNRAAMMLLGAGSRPLRDHIPQGA